MKSPAYQVHLGCQAVMDGMAVTWAEGDQGMPGNTGPQGPPGPTGANGAKDEQGAPDP